VRRLAPFLLSAVGLATASWAITLGQIDDFEDGTTMGWTEGIFSPNPPTNVPTGGPEGAGDSYLQNVSSGSIFAGGKMVMFNQTQWAGDYIAAGVTGIELWMANLGADSLFMRVGVQGALTQFVSTVSVPLAPGSGWQNVSFNLTTAGMSLVSGTASLSQVLSTVTDLRILSAKLAPSWQGDRIAATLGVDHITATFDPVPVPEGVETASWGEVKSRY
jgi:hypothetical protein